jgi:hypothetical protein
MSILSHEYSRRSGGRTGLRRSVSASVKWTVGAAYCTFLALSPLVLFWFTAGDSVDPEFDKGAYVLKVFLVWGAVFGVASAALILTMARPTTQRPGWYSDPRAPTCYRWWDGREWTDRVWLPPPPRGA